MYRDGGRMIKGIRHRILNVRGRMEARRLVSKYTGKEMHFPPVFIVGAPRTGSTLLFQMLSSTDQFFYLNNFIIDRFQVAFQASCDYLSRFRSFSHQNFSSDFGMTEGPNAPHEGGYFWYRWFPENKHAVDAGELSATDIAELKAYHIAFEELSGRAILHKNLNCGLRLRALSEVFPQILVIHIGRDALDTAYSIYQGRQKYNGQVKEWFSLKPKGYEDWLSLPAEDQIVNQIEAINRTVIADAQDLPGIDRIFVSYEDILKDPMNVWNTLGEWLGENGQRLENDRREAIGTNSLPTDRDGKDSEAKFTTAAG